MFVAKTDDISLLRDSIAVISELIDEVELKIGINGFEMIAADRAVVAVVDFKLSKDVFNEYSYEKDMKIGLNLVNLLQIFRRAKENDKVTMMLEENKMKIVFEGESKRSFSLPLIDVSRDEPPPLDKLEFPASISINTNILSSGIDDADLITDSMIFTLNRNQLTMRSESNLSSTQLDLLTGTDYLRILNVVNPVRARYSLDYLKKIIKAKKLTDNAKISFSNDYPMKLQFDVPNKLELSFILAPRVEE